MVQVPQPFRPEQNHNEKNEKNITDTVVAIETVCLESLLDSAMNSIESQKMIDQY